MSIIPKWLSHLFGLANGKEENTPPAVPARMKIHLTQFSSVVSHVKTIQQADLPILSCGNKWDHIDWLCTNAPGNDLTKDDHDILHNAIKSVIAEFFVGYRPAEDDCTVKTQSLLHLHSCLNLMTEVRDRYQKSTEQETNHNLLVLRTTDNNPLVAPPKDKAACLTAFMAKYRHLIDKVVLHEHEPTPRNKAGFPGRSYN